MNIAIIPARYASTRFPGKPLVLIQGKTMIQRVVEQVLSAKKIDRIIVATDDDRIFLHVKNLGYEVAMTAEHHQSGTDRCAEVAASLGLKADDVIVNIQGDEPFIQPSQIDDLVDFIHQKKDISIATLVKKISDETYLDNPNIVKVIFNATQKAIYFSRHPIPFVRGFEQKNWLQQADFYKHIGLYAYRWEALQKITLLPTSSLERSESLEQLRWLENDFNIGIKLTALETIGIDTPEDLEKIKNLGVF
jgi:3-deoxy-manno-octulosonate cytidylyltransferase (CMP-KDO synthetase)